MKVVILAGGLGTRISEYTKTIPKPMIKICGKPIIQRIIDHYYSYGHREFYIALGYKGKVIRDYFNNKKKNKKIRIHLIDTGKNTMTGGRLKRLKKFLNETFLLTYGDGLSDIDLNKLQSLHQRNNNLVTLSGVFPPPRFGGLKISGNQIESFIEKPANEVSRVNGGFMICNKNIFNYLTNDEQSFEIDVLPLLAMNNQLGCFKHNGFWQPMDTLRDKKLLQRIWDEGQALWKN